VLIPALLRRSTEANTRGLFFQHLNKKTGPLLINKQWTCGEPTPLFVA